MSTRLELTALGVRRMLTGRRSRRTHELRVTGYGVLMRLLVVIPALFGGYFTPLTIGAPGMAFPRLDSLDCRPHI